MCYCLSLQQQTTLNGIITDVSLSVIIQHLNCILYSLNLVVHIKTLSTENLLEYYLFSDNYLVNLLKSMKKKQTLSRSARSAVEGVLLFLVYTLSERVMMRYTIYMKPHDARCVVGTWPVTYWTQTVHHWLFIDNFLL